MFCPNCGSIVNETDALCTNCGAPLGEARQQAQQQPAFQAVPPPQPNYQAGPPQQPYPGYQQPYPGNQQPYPPQPYYGAPQSGMPKPNFLTSKIMIVVGILVTVCFFVSWITGYSVSGFDSWRLNFETIEYLGDVFSAGSMIGFLAILQFIFTIMYIFIPISGLTTFLALTNSRSAIKTARTFASLGFTGMVGNLLMGIIISAVATSNSGYGSYMGDVFSEMFRFFSFAYWACLLGELAIMIALGIDLNKNKPARLITPYY